MRLRGKGLQGFTAAFTIRPFPDASVGEQRADLELMEAVQFPSFAGWRGRLRVTSFAECNDHLYAAVGQQIYERIDETARPLAANIHQSATPAGPRVVCAA